MELDTQETWHRPRAQLSRGHSRRSKPKNSLYWQKLNLREAPLHVFTVVWNFTSLTCQQ